MSIKKHEYYVDNDGSEHFLARIVRVDGGRCYFIGLYEGEVRKLTDDDWVDYDYLKNDCKQIEQEEYDRLMRFHNSELSSTPEHYNQGSIEPKDFINSHNLNFNLGCCVKYVCRAEYKGSQEQDLRKAIDYLNFELERINNLTK